jgi:hexosaminidase
LARERFVDSGEMADSPVQPFPRQTSTNEPLLLPRPRKIERRAGICSFDRSKISSRIDPAVGQPQGYRLVLSADGIDLTSHDAAGMFYGHQTLSQLHTQYGSEMPCLWIEDWPDFAARGVMLDISRDKVPTMATLVSLIDKLATWKINQIQLYTEHTFAYRNHPEVWAMASPLTAAEIQALGAYCRERFIDLVPNQNSFGHMERWLKHPRYLPLAEAPLGAQTPWGFFWEGPFSLCPTDPRSLELLAELYAELLPNFSSRLFNVGCDETFDVGLGRSAEQCQKHGTTRVYLDFLKQVHALAKGHGRTMMFWGDIIKKHPELIGELEGAIGLIWGYEADSPFGDESAAFERAGVPFYVCPGTSSWCSIAGRTDNMLANAKSAASNGLRHGAIGYLMTDWGDHGHLQYLPVSYAGFAAGAACSWCHASNAELDLVSLLDLHAFGDQAGVIGKLACDLGNVYQTSGKQIPNASSLFRILVPPPTPKVPAAGMTASELEAARAAIDAAMARLSQSRMAVPDAALIEAEFRNAAAMLRLACDLGEAEISGQTSAANSEFSRSLASIIEEHRRLWLARNREGGLDDSAARLLALDAR